MVVMVVMVVSLWVLIFFFFFTRVSSSPLLSSPLLFSPICVSFFFSCYIYISIYMYIRVLYNFLRYHEKKTSWQFLPPEWALALLDLPEWDIYRDTCRSCNCGRDISLHPLHHHTHLDHRLLLQVVIHSDSRSAGLLLGMAHAMAHDLSSYNICICICTCLWNKMFVWMCIYLCIYILCTNYTYTAQEQEQEQEQKPRHKKKKKNQNMWVSELSEELSELE